MNPIDTVKNAFASLTRGRRAGLRIVALTLIPVAVAVIGAAVVAPALDNSDRIPVAVVNLDVGYTTDAGSKVHAGQDVVDSLEDSDDLAWDFVDEETADAGLEDGTYALVLKIPESYSEDVESVNTDSPKKATIDIVSSGSENVLATRVGSAVLKQVQARLKSDLGENYALSVLSSVGSQASKLTLAADGAVMLDSGYDTLADGVDSLGDGLDQVAEASSSLGEGIEQISSGAGELDSGAQTVATGLASVSDQMVIPLAQGADSLASGLDTMGTTAQTMGEGLVSIGGTLSQLGDSLAADNQTLLQLMQTVPALSLKTASLAQDLTSAGDASNRMVQAATQLASGIEDVQQKTGEVSSAASQLASALDHDSADEGDTVGLKQQLAALETKIDAATDTAAEVAEAMAADDAAGQLPALKEKLDGAVSALNGLKAERDALSERMESIAASAKELSSTAADASASLAESADARTQLANAASDFATASGQTLTDGQEVATTGGQVATSAGTAATDLVTVQTVLSGAGSTGGENATPGVASSITSIGQGVYAMGGQLASSGAVGSGASALSMGTAALSQVLSPLATAVSGIGTGAGALQTALSTVATGASSLTTGLSTMAAASSGLSTGVTQLKDASSQLTGIMDTAGSELSGVSSSSSDKAKVASNSLTFTSSTVHAQRSTMALVAPVFIAAALWCAVLAASQFMGALDARRVLRGSGAAAVFTAFLPLLAVALLQVALLACVSCAIAGSWTYVLPVLGALALAALAIAAVHQTFRILCGKASAAVSLALLALQVVAAGGILPRALASGISSLFAWLPVSQLAGALRYALVGNIAASGVWPAALAVATVVALALSCGLAARRRVVHPERLACA